jgi:hypothetical protein
LRLGLRHDWWHITVPGFVVGGMLAARHVDYAGQREALRFGGWREFVDVEELCYKSIAGL